MPVYLELADGEDVLPIGHDLPHVLVGRKLARLVNERLLVAHERRRRAAERWRRIRAARAPKAGPRRVLFRWFWREHRRALDARPAEDRRRLVAAEIMRAVYFETLRRIELNDYDVFNSRLRVPRPRQAVIALRQWLLPV
jgi:hypothetical protein